VAGSLYVQNFKKRSFVALLLSFVVLFGLISSVIAKPAQAKTVRLALVSSLEGDVTVKKGGGSKIYDAYANMSLNQGDTLYTGSNSSVVLDVSNGDSEITIGADSEFNISDLAGGNAKKSKLKMWAGSMWVKVKSLAGSNDEFEVETPTAVMGVRGTQFFVGVNPNTGKTTMAVGAGKVAASVVTYNQDGSAQQNTKTLILPTQQITLDSRDEVKDLSLKVEPIDIDAIVNSSSGKVIEAIVKNKQSIDDENAQFIEDQKKKLEQGQKDDNSNFSIKDLNELNKITKNLDNLVGNIVITAIDNKVIDKDKIQKVIDEANNKITDPAKKLDLDKVVPLDKAVGFDPEKEKLRQQLLEQLQAGIKKSEEERKKQEEDLRKLLEAALKQAEEQAMKMAELNKKAASDAAAKAEAIFKENLSDADKTKFEAEKKKQSTTPSTSQSTSPSTGSEPSSDSSPSPTGDVKINKNDSSTSFKTVELDIVSTTATQMSISEESTPATDNWEPLTAKKTITFSSDAAGTKRVYVKFKNAEGTTSLAAATDDINYVIPTITAVSSIVNSNSIYFTATAYNAKQFLLSESSTFASAPPQDYVASQTIPFTLSNGNGSKTVYARFIDGTGNTSDAAPVVVTLDKPLPGTPVVNPVYASDNYVTGTATANTAIKVKIGLEQFEGSSGSSGHFSVSIPSQVAGTKLSIIAMPILTGDTPSAAVSVTVIRLPDVKLTLSTPSQTVGLPFDLDISMSDFDTLNEFYAVEIHLLYSPVIDFDEVKTAGTIFTEANSVDNAREFEDLTHNKELVYVITNYGDTNNITAFSGPKKLVTLQFKPNDVGSSSIEVGYIKIVRKDGNEILKYNKDSIDPVPLAVIGGGVS
jgi:hypothetical protein